MADERIGNNWSRPVMGVANNAEARTMPLLMDPITGRALIDTEGGFSLPSWDYCSMALSNGNATETYTFKSGGSSGTTVATVAVVYTDSTREVLSSVTVTTS